MDKSTIITLVSNMGSPAFLADEDGKVLLKNISMRYIRERLGTGELHHLNEMEIVLGGYEAHRVRKFKIRDTNIDGLVYYLDYPDGDKVRMFVFDRSISADKTMTDIMEHIDEVVVIFNQYGVIEKINSIADSILPFSREDIVGKDIRELVKMGMVEDPIILKLIEKKQKVYGDIAYPNGKVISYTAIPVFGSRGNFRGGVLTGRDISRIISLVQQRDRNEEDEDVEYISVSDSMREIKNMVDTVAASDATVFITGESGVGKEVLARRVWKNSGRRNGPFMAVNCGAIPSELIESEFFGYEKGAFTGANAKGKEGLLEAANGGTLFMDEIGELPLDMQKKLLRAIQEGTIIRVGGTKTKKINVRFICATNKTTEELRNPAVFRQDLYYRLNVIPVEVPALRDRREDIMPLVGYYLQHFNGKYHRKVFLAGDAERVLYEYQWPGNIRELKNVIERCVVLAPHDEIDGLQMDRMLSLGGLDKIQGKQFIESVEAVERQRDAAESSLQKDEEGESIVIKEIMDINEAHRICEQIIIKKAVEKYGNVTKAAEAVGINPSTIYRKIKSGHLEL